MFVVESFVMGVTVSPALLGTIFLLCQHPFSSSHTCPERRTHKYIVDELLEILRSTKSIWIVQQYKINNYQCWAMILHEAGDHFTIWKEILLWIIPFSASFRISQNWSLFIEVTTMTTGAQSFWHTFILKKIEAALKYFEVNLIISLSEI